ncbi:hypothetical protein BGZ94_000136 [Podila epigama]|nr:hypothetical protein BGZ94_000136 [Podila epigama]
MTSLFQSTAKGSSSSSSSSSSSANPLQALSHFYEQELTTESSSSRHLQPQQPPPTSTHHHLFPSSITPPQSSSSSSSPTVFKSPPPVPDRSNLDLHTFQSFSSNNSDNSAFSSRYNNLDPTSSPQHPSHHVNTNAHADLSEYLKQRQEYYLREAALRSQDQHDGLGPIVDYSVDAKAHQHLIDHLTTKHHNPYTSSSLRHPYQPRSHSSERPKESHPLRATSQLEQVWLDSIPSLPHQEHNWDALWNRESVGPSGGGPPLSSNASSMTQRFHTTTPVHHGSLVASFKDAAASIPSSWPLPPWAIETQAAIMEFETIFKDYGPATRPTEQSASIQASDRSMMMADKALLSERKQDEPVVTKGPAQVAAIEENHESKGSVKTCGFMLDGHNKMDYGLLIDAPRMIPSVDQSALLTPVVTESTVETLAPVTDSTTVSATGANASVSTPEQNMMAPIRKVYNDDVFEGDMLQAWMESLALEKQEQQEQQQQQQQWQQVERVVDEKARSQERQVETGTSSMTCQMPSSIAPVATFLEPKDENKQSEELFGSDDMMQTWMNVLEQEKQETDERILEELDKSHKEMMMHPQSVLPDVVVVVGEVHNDDVFEDEMLRSWVSVLEQEKREADEKARQEKRIEEQDEEDVEDSARDKLAVGRSIDLDNGPLHERL